MTNKQLKIASWVPVLGMPFFIKRLIAEWPSFTETILNSIMNGIILATLIVVALSAY